jgi:hypothetical protein
MKTALADFLSTGTETAPLLSTKVKDVGGNQFTVKLTEILSGEDTRPVTQDTKAAPIDTKGQVIRSTDSIVESGSQGSIESRSQGPERQAEGSITSGNAQLEAANSTAMAASDPVQKPATLMCPASGSEMQVDCLPFIPATKQIDSDGAQSPRPLNLQKNEEKGNRFEKADLKSHRVNGESKTRKKVPGKERPIDAQTATQATESDSELSAGSVQGSYISVPTVERPDLKQSNETVESPEQVKEKPLSTIPVTPLSKSLSGGETKQSNEGAQLSDAAQGESEPSASKASVETGQLSSKSKAEKKEATSTGTTGSTIAHRPEQTAMQSTGTTQVQIGSTATHRDSATGNLAVSERRTAAELVSNGTTTNNQPHILKATTNTLEVGVANDTHGWVKVRAEMTNDGRVNASLSSNSPTAQQMLRHELPSLATFLRAENVQVGSLTVQVSESTSERGGLPGNGAGPDQGNQSHGGGQSGDRYGGKIPDLPDSGVGPALSGTEMILEEMGNDWMYVSGGSWLNVIA